MHAQASGELDHAIDILLQSHSQGNDGPPNPTPNPKLSTLYQPRTALPTSDVGVELSRSCPVFWKALVSGQIAHARAMVLAGNPRRRPDRSMKLSTILSRDTRESAIHS